MSQPPPPNKNVTPPSEGGALSLL